MSDSVDAQFATAADALLGRIDDVLAAMFAHLEAALPPEYGPGTEGWELIHAGGIQSVRTELEHLRQEVMPAPEAVAVDREGSRISAATGAGIDWVLFLYRAGHRAQWNGWFEVVEAMGLESETRRALLARGSAFFFAYADRLGRYVSEAYLEQRELIVGSIEQRRAHAVSDLLAGRPADPEALGHPLDGRHVAVVASGPRAQRALEATAVALGRTTLVVAQPGDTWWGWLSGPEEITSETVAPLLAERLGAGATAGVGEDHGGPEGFRRSHEQASAAHRSTGDDHSVVSFGEIALEALAAADPAAAREFTARELRRFDDASERSRRLRETLEAWFAAGQNAAATAARLGVHEQTVAQRLRAVEDRTGHAPAARRAELETALRLRRHLDTS